MVLLFLIFLSLDVRSETLDDLCNYKTNKASSFNNKEFFSKSSSFQSKKSTLAAGGYPVKTFEVKGTSMGDKTFDDTQKLVQLGSSTLGSKTSSLSQHDESSFQHKSGTTGRTISTENSDMLKRKKAEGFSGEIEKKAYEGRLPSDVQKAFEEQQKKNLTIDELKELLNKNK